MTSLYTSLAASRRCRMTHAMLKYATTDLHLRIVETNEIPGRIIERQKQLSTRDSNENLECAVTSLCHYWLRHVAPMRRTQCTGIDTNWINPFLKLALNTQTSCRYCSNRENLPNATRTKKNHVIPRASLSKTYPHVTPNPLNSNVTRESHRARLMWPLNTINSISSQCEFTCSFPSSNKTTESTESPDTPRSSAVIRE